MNVNKIKHIFIDFDGTLYFFGHDHPYISEKNIVALNKLSQFSIGYSIVTGRYYLDIIGMLKQFGIKNCSYIIGIAGAQTYDCKHQKLVNDYIFDNSNIDSLKIALNFLKANYYNYYTFNVYTANQNPKQFNVVNYINDESQVFYDHIGLEINRMVNNVKNIDFYITHNIFDFLIYKITLHFYFENKNQFQNVVNQLKNLNLSDLDFIICGPNYLEILLKKVNKGSAIINLLNNHLHLDANQTLCFGDSDNDITMFEVIKNSVTRFNASKTILKMSKTIMLEDIFNFVANGINHLVFSQIK